MCAGFEQRIGPAESNQLSLALGLALDLPEATTTQTIRPTDQAFVLSKESIFQASFGIHRASRPMLINARSETMHERPTFRRLLDRGRTLVPMSGFYEPGPNGSVLFSAPTEAIMPLILVAALADYSLQSFVILTQDADDIVKPVHNRMPVLIHPSRVSSWLEDGVLHQETITLVATAIPKTAAKSRRRTTLATAQFDEPDPPFVQGTLE